MGDLALFVICTLTAWCVFFVALPWLARHGTLYGLHGLRDQVYSVAVADRTVADTLIYTDVEFMTSAAIHAVRDRSYDEAVKAWMALFRKDAGGTTSDWRLRRYRHEIEEVFITSPTRREALGTLFRVFEGLKLFMGVHVIGGQPVIAIMLLVMIVLVVAVAAAWKLAKAMSPAPPPESQVALAASQISALSRDTASVAPA